MNSKAFYAVLLVILVPGICYFLVKHYSEKALVMPRHYFAESINTTTKNGKQSSDTTWHVVPDFSLQNQMGQTVSLKDIHGKIIVADFFFTHCPTICPGMTLNMKRLQESINNSKRVGDKTADFIHFLSFSIDPERDSVQQLKKWADRFQINPEQWWLLTGPRKTIYDLSINEMKLMAMDGKNVDSDFIHTDFFVLMDSSHLIRGFYHGLDSASLAHLSQDIVLLSLERDVKKEKFLEGDLPLIAVVFLITIVIIATFFYAIRKKKN